MMLLGRQPPDDACLKLDLSTNGARYQPPTKRAQGVHHTVGMLMGRSALSREIPVLEHPNVVVLENDLVVLGVRDCGIQGHSGNRGSGRRMLTTPEPIRQPPLGASRWRPYIGMTARVAAIPGYHSARRPGRIVPTVSPSLLTRRTGPRVGRVALVRPRRAWGRDRWRARSRGRAVWCPVPRRRA